MTEKILSKGAQAERTRLAWNRTALAIATNAALLAHVGNPSLLRYMTALVMLLGAIACFVYADRRYREIIQNVRAQAAVITSGRTRVFAVLALAPPAIALSALIGLMV